MLKHIVFKHPHFRLASIGKPHFALSMLDSILPITLMHGSIGPQHNPLPVPLVFVVVTDVLVPTTPIETPEPVTNVVEEVADVFMPRRHAQLSDTPLTTAMKLPYILLPVFALVAPNSALAPVIV